MSDKIVENPMGALLDLISEQRIAIASLREEIARLKSDVVRIDEVALPYVRNRSSMLDASNTSLVARVAAIEQAMSINPANSVRSQRAADFAQAVFAARSQGVTLEVPRDHVYPRARSREELLREAREYLKPNGRADHSDRNLDPNL